MVINYFKTKVGRYKENDRKISDEKDKVIFFKNIRKAMLPSKYQ